MGSEILVIGFVVIMVAIPMACLAIILRRRVREAREGSDRATRKPDGKFWAGLVLTVVILALFFYLRVGRHIGEDGYDFAGWPILAVAGAGALAALGVRLWQAYGGRSPWSRYHDPAARSRLGAKLNLWIVVGTVTVIFGVFIYMVCNLN